MKKLIVSLALVCLFAGCSGGGAELTGKVTMDDGAPVPRGAVQLNGAGGSYSGGIQPDGTYTITGVPSGEYNVAVTGAMDSEPTEEAGMDYDDEGNFVESTTPEPKSLIKDMYSDPEKSGLKLSVPGSYDLKVDRAAGGAADASS
ncbi:MAG TPA: carboxypeptidase-like regulatory domain-containing protein [Pirellulaceae bacterium]|nr:carboxypeptidase-like regulatory domain-containing protein [Pirellulaceae bacterium]